MTIAAFLFGLAFGAVASWRLQRVETYDLSKIYRDGRRDGLRLGRQEGYWAGYKDGEMRVRFGIGAQVDRN